jgi:hypothetical protein
MSQGAADEKSQSATSRLLPEFHAHAARCVTERNRRRIPPLVDGYLVIEKLKNAIFARNFLCGHFLLGFMEERN